jgi:tetratricopeptide (TPR) repeat protein
MRKVLLLITSLFLLLRCGEEKATIKNEQSTIIDIAKYNEQELYDYIVFLEKNLLDTNNNSLVPSKENSIKLLESSNNFTERFPENKEIKNILYKGVRAARGLEKHHEAIRLLDKIIIAHPNDEQTVDLLFEKAFIQDENLKNTEEAKRIYTKISQDYPDHQFGKDSKARLITIDMTEEEFTNWLMEQNAQ